MWKGKGKGGLKAGRAVMPESLRAEISTSLFSTSGAWPYSDHRSSFNRARAPFSSGNHALLDLNNWRRKLLIKSCGLTSDSRTRRWGSE